MPPATSCDLVIQGSSGSGERCLFDDDCANEDEACGGRGCEKSCQPAGGMGQPCAQGSCDEGLFCRQSTSTCVALLPIGAQCDDYRECDPAEGYCDVASTICRPYAQAGMDCSIAHCGAGLRCDWSTSPRVCRPAGENAPCASAFDCIRGLRCISGACAQPRDEGEPCTQFDCRDDLYCEQAVCTVRKSDGESCRPAPSRFTIDCDQCPRGSACDFVERTCQPPRSVDAGAACTGDAVTCPTGYECRDMWMNPDGGAGLPGTCVLRRVGDSCVPLSRDNFVHDCPEGAACVVEADAGTGICVAASEGSACTGSIDCPVDHHCGGDMTCVPNVGQGEACSPTVHCREGLWCTPTAAGDVCTRTASLGEPCETGGFTTCLPPSVCQENRCVEAGRIGTQCLGGRFCLEGACQMPDAGQIGTCVPARGEGERCSRNSECASTWCDLGVCRDVCR